MKKTLILSLILAPIFSFAALTPCAPGDKFDLYTGKACAVATTNATNKDAYIASLIAQINALKAQLVALGGTYIPPVNSNPSVPPTGGTGTTPTPVTASASISLDPSTPSISTVRVTDVINGQNLFLPIFKFDITTQNGDVLLRNVKVNISTSGVGSVTAAYLYRGSNQISAVPVTNGLVDFGKIVIGTPGATISKDSTLSYTIKVDVVGVTTGNSLSVSASISGSDQTVTDDSRGYQIGLLGSANGNQVTVSN